MIIMALDHCRDFFHTESINGNNPLDFNTTTPGLFLTRWITHFCAPVFVFLAGTSIFFVRQKRPLKDVSVFLLTRGLWLILLEVTVISWGWSGNMNFFFTGLFVIWALGFSMIFMAGLVHLNKKVLLIIAALLVFGHNSLDGYDKLVTDDFNGFLWSVFHVPFSFTLDSSHFLFVGYPLMPWIGIMLFGFLFGNLYDESIYYEKRKKTLLFLGTACVLIFILLRSGNFYGDSHFWSQQATGLLSALSFVDTTKYPPSLMYALMTIGPAMLFLAFAEKWRGKILNMISIYGRVPFFYYLLHIYLIHFIALIIFFASGYQWSDIDHTSLFGGFPKGFGLELPLVYALWALVVILLYFPCRWYNKYKSTHASGWLSYL